MNNNKNNIIITEDGKKKWPYKYVKKLLRVNATGTHTLNGRRWITDWGGFGVCCTSLPPPSLPFPPPPPLPVATAAASIVSPLHPLSAIRDANSPRAGSRVPRACVTPSRQAVRSLVRFPRSSLAAPPPR